MGSKLNHVALRPARQAVPAGRGDAYAWDYARSLLPPMTGVHVHDPADAFVFILAYKREHDGNSPTTRDLMQHMRISSSSVALNIFRQLERAGLIRIDHQRSRAIRIPGGRWHWQGEEAKS